jgi:hypothetical protein
VRLRLRAETVGEDVSEKLDYTPGVFHAERHIRGKKMDLCKVPDTDAGAGPGRGDRQGQLRPRSWWRSTPITSRCIARKASLSVPVLPSRARRWAQWVGVCGVRLQPLVDALQASLLERSVLHADETPVAMLAPGKGSTHRAYLWSYSSTQFDSLPAVVYDFAESRAAAHPKAFLQGWRASWCATTTPDTRRCSLPA